MENRILKAEGLLRLLSLVLAALASCLVGFDTQTKKVLFMEKKATVKDLPALWVLTIVGSVVAGYQFIQLCKCFFFGRSADACSRCSKCHAWACLLLDQGVMYTMFAATAAATQAALIAVTGVDALQWRKACNVYTRFCEQIGGGILSGLMASLAMCMVSSISAFHLFKKYHAWKGARRC